MRNYCINHVVLFLGSCLLYCSCLKNKDSTGDGPKARMSITNYVVNGAAFDISFDDIKITSAALAFGNSIPGGSGGYEPFGAGIHNFKLVSGTALVFDNSLFLDPGKSYSVFFYDTLKNNKVKSLIFTDDLTVVDTIGKARFLQFIPRTDSLTLILTRDTLVFAVRDTYIGNKPDPSTESDFFMNLPPGNYQVQLQSNTSVLFQQSSFSILPGKLYSFVAKGVINGSGDYKERVTIVQHN
jgi:hypothetical protein